MTAIGPYQSHSSEDGDAVDALDGEVDEAGDDDDEVEDVPARGEVLLAQRHQLQRSLQREEGGENLWEEVKVIMNGSGKEYDEESFQIHLYEFR